MYPIDILCGDDYCTWLRRVKVHAQDPSRILRSKMRTVLVNQFLETLFYPFGLVPMIVMSRTSCGSAAS